MKLLAFSAVRSGLTTGLLFLGLSLLTLTVAAAEWVDDGTELPPRLAALEVGDELNVSATALGWNSAYAQTAIRLQRISVFSDGAEVVVHDDFGARSHWLSADSYPRYYRGEIANEPGSSVFASLDANGDLRGIVSSGGERWLLENSPPTALSGRPGSPPQPQLQLLTHDHDHDAHTFSCLNESAHRTDLFSSGGRSLGTADLENILRFAETAANSADAPHTARIAVETDHEFYQKFNDADAATRYIGDLIGFASAIYKTELNTDLQVSHVSLWRTANDPWTQEQSDCAMYEFGRYWNQNNTTVDRSLAHFISGKSTNAGIAWVGVLCRDGFNVNLGTSCPDLSPRIDQYGGDYGFSGGIDGNFNVNNPSIIWDSVVVAHEIGHNFNSPHTHDYAGLEGSNSAIDICVGVSNPDLPGLGSLNGGAPGTGAGTVMSYCHFRSGGLSNIAPSLGRNHAYGVLADRVPDRMRSHVEARAAVFPSCLAPQTTTAQYRLEVSKTGDGSGTVTSDGGEINCGSSCSASVDENSVIELTAQADGGSEFTGWSGACSGTGSCQLSMQADRTVTANFAEQVIVTQPTQHQLSVIKLGDGSGTVSAGGIDCGTRCSAMYDEDSVVELTAQAAAGSEFIGWSGDCHGTGSCQLSMQADRTAIAVFIQPVEPTPTRHRISVAKSGDGDGMVISSGGDINCGTRCSAEVAEGMAIELTAQPAEGSEFVGWSGDCAGTQSCLLTAQDDRAATALFNRVEEAGESQGLFSGGFE